MIKNKFNVLFGGSLFLGSSVLFANPGKDFWLLIASSVILIIIIIFLLIYLFRSRKNISEEELKQINKISLENNSSKKESINKKDKIIEEITIEETYDDIKTTTVSKIFNEQKEEEIIYEKQQVNEQLTKENNKTYNEENQQVNEQLTKENNKTYNEENQQVNEQLTKENNKTYNEENQQVNEQLTKENNKTYNEENQQVNEEIILSKNKLNNSKKENIEKLIKEEEKFDLSMNIDLFSDLSWELDNDEQKIIDKIKKDLNT